MKLGTPILAFQPRHFSQGQRISARTGTDPSYVAPDPRQELLEENPLYARGLDVAHVAHEALGSWIGLGQSPGMRFAAGTIAVNAAVWGTHKLLHGESVLDRIEGIGSLAMATDLSMDAAGFAAALGSPQPVAGTVLGLIHGSSDVIVGGADTVRGIREKDNRRLTAGVLQAMGGACAITSALLPATAPISSAVMLGAVFGRQLVLGAPSDDSHSHQPQIVSPPFRDHRLG